MLFQEWVGLVRSHQQGFKVLVVKDNSHFNQFLFIVFLPPTFAKPFHSFLKYNLHTRAEI